MPADTRPADTRPAVPDAWVTAGINGVAAFHKRTRRAVWDSPSSDEVAAVIAVVLPLERERIAAELERLALGAVPGVERDAWLGARQVVLHGLAEHSDRKEPQP